MPFVPIINKEDFIGPVAEMAVRLVSAQKPETGGNLRIQKQLRRQVDDSIHQPRLPLLQPEEQGCEKLFGCHPYSGLGEYVRKILFVIKQIVQDELLLSNRFFNSIFFLFIGALRRHSLP